MKALIEQILKEMLSAKMILTLWARWKKPVKSAITLDTEDVSGAQDNGANTSDNYIRVETPFNSLLKDFFEGSNFKELMQGTFAHIKTQSERP